jgi:phosphoribosylformimino-5-aminoimidazole carboxamide ribotide isomerase
VRVIGVIDLAGGLAVHARGGDRRHYAPVRSALLTAEAAGDAVALARAYRDRAGLDDIYVADLDAIEGLPAQRALVRELAGVGPTLWLDAGVTRAESAAAAVEDGAGVVVVGLETLPSFDELTAIVRAVGGSRVAFSLDLRGGVPLTRPGAPHDGQPAETLLARAADAGAAAVIVLDLARVGGGGIDVAQVARLRSAASRMRVYAGGGVRDATDLAHLADAGCDGALVATSLHDGTIGRADVERWRRVRA